MDADNRNELQIHVKGQRIFAYLINDESKQLISPDLATTTQECLTLALERILQFYHRCFGKQSHHLMSDLFEIEVGEVCKGETCLLPLCDAKTRKSWICKNGIEHKTKISLNWVFDKNKETCDKNCNGLGSEMLLLEPNDHHFVHLAQIMGIDEFREFLIHLGISTADYEKLNHCYFSNPMNFMLMGLFKWRDKAEIDQSISTFEELMRALTAIDRKHYLCKVQREDHSLMVKSHSRLQDVPSEDVIKALTQKNLIGDCVVHFGIELGLTSVDISKTLYNFQRDLDGQIHDLLMKWRKTDGKKPTIYWLMVALKRVQAVKGLKYVKKTYCVE
ncbi:LRDD [Mytilus edulis]|uniref:LRDD n=1 Tax=Mytilus edulis TaxID=6550 RepID=A0A8S3PYN9_MYTED|nr:LRDD [Mytilus edulis]